MPLLPRSAKMNFALLDSDWHRCELPPEAGPGDAKPIVDPEQRPVRATKKQGFIVVQKLIFLPVERRSGMWAIVDIGADLACLAHQKHLEAHGAITEGEATTLVIANLFSAAQKSAFRRP